MDQNGNSNNSQEISLSNSEMVVDSENHEHMEPNRITGDTVASLEASDLLRNSISTGGSELLQQHYPPPPSPFQLANMNTSNRTAPALPTNSGVTSTVNNLSQQQQEKQERLRKSKCNNKSFKTKASSTPSSLPSADPQARLRAHASFNAARATTQSLHRHSIATSSHQYNSNNFTVTSPAITLASLQNPVQEGTISVGGSIPYMPPSQNHSCLKDSKLKSDDLTGEWKVVELAPNFDLDGASSSTSLSSSPPCERSLHACAQWNDQLLIFGGYDGQMRRNDFYSFHLKKRKWSLIVGSGDLPNPRDRHCATVYGNSFYIFGGFDGTSRVNDFYEFDFTTMRWKRILSNVSVGSSPPSPRHSHSAVVYQDSMFVFGGYDGSYRSDLYEYNFLNNTWINVPAIGRFPRPRYRATSVVYKSNLVVYGGHDGTRHLSDVHFFNFNTRDWTMIVDIVGTPPLPRDSHISATCGDSIFIFGGSAGSALNDVHELRFKDHNDDDSDNNNNTAFPQWRQVKEVGTLSCTRRFCHVGSMYDGCLYVFGGYDGHSRLNDFMKFELHLDDLAYNIPQSSLVTDMRSFVNNDALSDVVFIVDGQTIYAHKLMLVRCNYFRAMLTGSMMESKLSTIHIEEVSYDIFLAILEYLYTDKLAIEVKDAMEIFAAADLFGIPRLQSMCEKTMLESIHPENAATIFYVADEHSACVLRKKSLKYILKHFEAVSRSQAFEEMARNNVELVVEILRLR